MSIAYIMGFRCVSHSDCNPQGLKTKRGVMKRVVVALFLAASLAAPVLAKVPQPVVDRTVTNFDFDWHFKLGDPHGAESVAFNDASWRKLDVPHDWSIEGEYKEDNPGVAISAFLPTGTGWYRKSFNVTPEMMRKDTTVLFDGVFMDSTTWINGVKLGNEPYGYMSFHYELSKYLHVGRNVIAVRVNNLLQPAARWYTGSGIYGHVKLIETAHAHIAMWSTFVRTASVDGDRAMVAVSMAAEGATPAMSVRFTVLDAQHREVAAQSVAAGAAAPDLAHPVMVSVPHPALWSTDAPNLYTLRTELMDGGRVVDSESTTFGVRTMVFDADEGFLLNGKVLKLRGVGDHLYGGPMGTAIPDGILERRLQ